VCQTTPELRLAASGTGDGGRKVIRIDRKCSGASELGRGIKRIAGAVPIIGLVWQVTRTAQRVQAQLHRCSINRQGQVRFWLRSRDRPYVHNVHSIEIRANSMRKSPGKTGG